MNKYTTYKTSPWEESSKPIQCHKCNKIGHTRLNCRASDPTCALCSQKHEMSTCPNKEKPDFINALTAPDSTLHSVKDATYSQTTVALE